MPDPTANDTVYEIVMRGRASSRLLRPLLDDFIVDHPPDGTTRLVGGIRDSSHLHGVVAHLTAVNAELISITPRRPSTASPSSANPSSTQPTTNPERNPQP